MMESKTFTFHLPCYMHIGKEKISLNLNWYRNAHFFNMNKTKQNYNPFKIDMFKADKISISYTLVWNSNRRTDFMNWIVVADKYFVDWLVSVGCIPDDRMTNYSEAVITSIIDKSVRESYIIAEVKVLE